jgi:hypothetical protein
VPGLFKEFYTEATCDPNFDDDIPNEEYQYIGIFMGQVAWTLRNSLGDFDFSADYYLYNNENWLAWLIWFMIVVI